MEEDLRFAIRLAFRMGRDPELESIAGEKWWHATVTFDPSLGVPLRAWIARCVKQGVWEYWRSKQIRRRPHTGADPEPPAPDQTERDLLLSQPCWRMLVEHYIDKWPLDVMCREYGLTVRQMRNTLALLAEKLKEAVCRS